MISVCLLFSARMASAAMNLTGITRKAMWTLVFTLLIAGEAHGSSDGAAAKICDSYLDPDEALAAGPLTAPTTLVLGDAIARMVVRATNFDPIWLEYQDHPDYDGGLVFEPKHALCAVMDAGREFRAWRDEFATIYAGTRVRWPRFFVTHRPLGLRALNRLSSKRIHAIGLIDRVVRVDGRAMTPAEFLIHDVAHAYVVELLTHPNRFYDEPDAKRRAAREFFSTFRYEREVRRLTPREHVLFDIGYALYFREDLADQTWAYRYAALALQPRVTRAEVADLYHETAHSRFHIEGTEVRFNASRASVLTRRFLDRDDLRPNLPIEIEAALRTDPFPSRVVEKFLEAALSTFYTAHFRHALRRLGVIKTSTDHPR